MRDSAVRSSSAQLWALKCSRSAGAGDPPETASLDPLEVPSVKYFQQLRNKERVVRQQVRGLSVSYWGDPSDFLTPCQTSASEEWVGG